MQAILISLILQGAKVHIGTVSLSLISQIDPD